MARGELGKGTWAGRARKNPGGGLGFFGNLNFLLELAKLKFLGDRAKLVLGQLGHFAG
jgi:hypothetical protein